MFDFFIEHFRESFLHFFMAALWGRARRFASFPTLSPPEARRGCRRYCRLHHLS